MPWHHGWPEGTKSCRYAQPLYTIIYHHNRPFAECLGQNYWRYLGPVCDIRHLRHPKPILKATRQGPIAPQPLNRFDWMEDLNMQSLGWSHKGVKMCQMLKMSEQISGFYWQLQRNVANHWVNSIIPSSRPGLHRHHRRGHTESSFNWGSFQSPMLDTWSQVRPVRCPQVREKVCETNAQTQRDVYWNAQTGRLKLWTVTKDHSRTPAPKNYRRNSWRGRRSGSSSCAFQPLRYAEAIVILPAVDQCLGGRIRS